MPRVRNFSATASIFVLSALSTFTTNTSVGDFAPVCINPNFKYCVFSTGWKEELYLTDDIGKAMEKAAALSKTKGDFFSVYSIKKAKDDTYRTYTESTWTNGHLLSEDHDEFLHYDFLSQMAKKIVKL